MSAQIKRRRGTTAEVGAMTPAEGELVVDTTLDTVCVGDGSTAGGHRLAKYSEVSGIVADGDKGDITVGGSGTTLTIDNDAVSNAKLANMATQTFKGRTTAGAGDPEDLTATQATAILNAMVGDSGAGGTKGLVPAPVPGDAAAGTFLKADGSWSIPVGTGAPTDPEYIVAAADAGIPNARVLTDTSDIVWDNTTPAQMRAGIAAGAVGDTKLRDSGACSVIGRSANSSGDPADISAAANFQMLQRLSNALTWAEPPMPIALAHSSNSAVAAGAQTQGNQGSTSLVARFEVPTGKTFHVVGASGGWDTGAGVGTWTIYLIARVNGVTSTRLVTDTTAVASTTGSFSATGTLAAPLVSYSAGDLIQVGIENDATSPGPLGTNTKGWYVWGWLV